jgi:hypothetical protein
LAHFTPFRAYRKFPKKEAFAAVGEMRTGIGSMLDSRYEGESASSKNWPAAYTRGSEALSTPAKNDTTDGFHELNL